MKKKINIGIIGRNFGYNVIYKSIIRGKLFNVIGFSFRNNKKKAPRTFVKITTNNNKYIFSFDRNGRIIIIDAMEILDQYHLL